MSLSNLAMFALSNFLLILIIAFLVGGRRGIAWVFKTTISIITSILRGIFSFILELLKVPGK